MTTDDSTSLTTDRTRQPVTRRHLLAVGGGVGLTLLAGCSGRSTDGSDENSGETSTGDATESSTDSSNGGSGVGTAGTTGTFRLLVSDQPVAIDDFDSLDVSFEKARVFNSQREDTADASVSTDTGTGTETANTTVNTTSTPTPTETATATVTESTTEPEDGSAAAESDTDEEAEEESRGFTVIDLDGATVDLTRLVGERASSVFTGELETGRYTKIELYAATVDGIVGGESVDVEIPSGKLMLTKPFTVEAGETLSFVFDINVVRKGNDGYNLLPVISESGVAGEDVAVEEVDSDEATGTETTTSTSTSTSSGGSSQGNGKGKEQS